MSLRYSGTQGNAFIVIASQLTLELPNAREIWEHEGSHKCHCIFDLLIGIFDLKSS